MSKYRSQQHWLKLITECRQSGMTDMDWCRANGISRSTFYKAVKRLRDAACELPSSVVSSDTCMDLTSACNQDVVPIRIISEEPSTIPDTSPECHSSYAMEITAGNLTIKISNDINTRLLSCTFKAIGGIL